MAYFISLIVFNHSHDNWWPTSGLQVSFVCVWPRVSLHVTGRLRTRFFSLPSTPRMPDWVLRLVLPLRRGREVGGEVPGTSFRRPLQWRRTGRAQLLQQRAQAARAQGCPAGECQSQRPGFLLGGRSHEHPLPDTQPHLGLARGQQAPSAGPAVCTHGLGQGATGHSWGSGVGGPLPRASPGPSSQMPVKGPPWKQSFLETPPQASVLTH